MIEKYTSAGVERPRSREFLADKRRVVVKIGSGSIFDGDNSIRHDTLLKVGTQVDQLMRAGHEVILVSSGAVAMGRTILADSYTNGASISDKRMLAAVGQPALVNLWRGYMMQAADICNYAPISVGQVLPTHSTLQESADTFRNLLAHGILPVVNYNDPLDDYEMNEYEINAADNDALAGHLARELEADALVILTDTPGILNSQGATIAQIIHGDLASHGVSFGDKSALGTGGMQSKYENVLRFTHQKPDRVGAISLASSDLSIYGPLMGRRGEWTSLYRQP